VEKEKKTNAGEVKGEPMEKRDTTSGNTARGVLYKLIIFNVFYESLLVLFFMIIFSHIPSLGSSLSFA